MKKIIILFIFVINLFAYTQEDWKVYDGCKERVEYGIVSKFIPNNKYDYEACIEMLNHKGALKKYGAASSYKYWIRRLGK